MRCPFCKELDTDKVIDSRQSDKGNVIRRRRECTACGRRFTTKERIDADVRLQVIKKDGTRIPYDRSKILGGIQKACYKRAIPDETLQKVVDAVEETIFRRFDREVTSQFIGEEVSRQLREVDQIAYVRYASVYREFQDVGDFVQEVKDVLDRAGNNSPNQGSLF